MDKKFIITAEELTNIARYLESQPLGQVLGLYEMLRIIEKREYKETE